MSVNNEAKTTKLVTQWDISTINYSSGSSAFEGSYMEEWLNDTSVDGFLGNLRDYENFIVTDATWDATMDGSDLGSIVRPNGSTMVTDTVGLLNMYEYQTSYMGTDYSNGYLNNGIYWWTLTPHNSSEVCNLSNVGTKNHNVPSSLSRGIRPSINLKFNVKIVDGNGTEDNPYRLEGDNDTNLSGIQLNARYSGEYLTFGTGENNLYRIVSHENGTGTKIVSAEPLKDSGSFITSTLGSDSYSSTITIGLFLNGEYLTNYVGGSYNNMIEDITTWYLGTVGNGVSYKIAKYTDTSMQEHTINTSTAKVGLLRFGELMAGQFNTNTNNISYWTLTPYTSSYVHFIFNYGHSNHTSSTGSSFGIKPSMNLKSNVVITGGDGTKQRPFTLALQ